MAILSVQINQVQSEAHRESGSGTIHPSATRIQQH